MKKTKSVRRDLRIARSIWGGLPEPLVHSLVDSLKTHNFSVTLGDLLLLNGRWYVTHSGLLRLAIRKRCHSIRVQPVREFSNAARSRFVFKATAYTAPGSKGFVGYGDADPSNVSSVVRGAELRVAETRAVNRALRKAYGIGICSIEEIGSFPATAQPQRQASKLPPQPANGNYSGPKVRDRLCQIIRQHQLDPNLVKSYAVDFCATKTLREATRQQVENFVAHLADWAEKDRNALLCQLNSYLPAKGDAA